MTCPTTFEFDVDYFREHFPAFANETTYPDELLQLYWDTAILYISNKNFGNLNGDTRFYAINLLVAHIAYTSNTIAAGNNPGIVQNAGVDKVSVGLVPPPSGKSEFKFWLYTSPYGMQLAALLSTWAAGGFAVGGFPELAAYRKAGGVFY